MSIPVLPLAGASSITLALAASGLNGQSFAFVGYTPSQDAERVKRLRELEQLSQRLQQTQILIETPYRNQALHAALVRTLAPNTMLAVACGLTLEGGWCRSQPVARWRKEAATGTTPPFPADHPAVFSLLAP